MGLADWGGGESTLIIDANDQAVSGEYAITFRIAGGAVDVTWTEIATVRPGQSLLLNDIRPPVPLTAQQELDVSVRMVRVSEDGRPIGAPAGAELAVWRAGQVQPAERSAATEAGAAPVIQTSEARTTPEVDDDTE